MQKDKSGKVAGVRRNADLRKAKPNDIDAMVSDFLAELRELSFEAAHVPQTRIKEKHTDGMPAKPCAVQSPASEDSEPGKEKSLEPDLETERINEELEESLRELEHLKTEILPVQDRKDPGLESLPANEPELEVSDAALAWPKDEESAAISSSQQDAEPEEYSAPRYFEEVSPDIRRLFASSNSSYYHSRSKFRRNMTVGLAAAILILILGIAAIYLSRSSSEATKEASSLLIQPPLTVNIMLQLPGLLNKAK